MKKLKTIVIYGGKLTDIKQGAFDGISDDVVIKIKASKKNYKKVLKAIKDSGISENIKIVRVSPKKK